MPIKLDQIIIHPIEHTSVILETPSGTIYCDPVGDPVQYADKPPADLVLITHHHGDHLDNVTLSAVINEAPLFSNQSAIDEMTPDLAACAQLMKNGDTIDALGISITAIPAYNITPNREQFHPKGRDNGYLLTINGKRVLLSADTEDTPELCALENIDIALLCMNLPFTMDVRQAANAVNQFRPKIVIPNHFRGKDGGTQDPFEFASFVDEGIQVIQGDWYGLGPGRV